MPKMHSLIPESVVVLSYSFKETTINILPTGIKIIRNLAAVFGCNILYEFSI
jgi:hypothetical protein